MLLYFLSCSFFQVFELCVADNEKASTLRWCTQKTYRTITKKFCCFENFCSSLTRRQTDCQQNKQGMFLTSVLCFVHPIFDFWSLLAMKLRKYFVIFVYICKMGKTEKNRKENHATEVTKVPKTKRRKYGMNVKTWQNTNK